MRSGSLYKIPRFLLCFVCSLFSLQITLKMDTQTAYPRGYNQEYDGDPNINVRHQHGEGEDDHHHEKNSVLKKVKAKAKKIKDTIKKHGHGHNHDHDHDHDHGHEYHEGHVPDDHDLDEEDEDEEEIVEDPGVLGAPMYESAAVIVRSVVSGEPEDLSRPGITSEGSKAMLPDPLASRESSETLYSGNYYKTKDKDPPNSSVNGLEALVTEQPRVNFGKTTVIIDEPLAPQNTPLPSSRSKDANPTKIFVHKQEEYPGQPKVNLQRPKGLEEDPAAPKDSPDAYTTTNYQTKVTDPTGQGEEAIGITPILHSLDKMNIYDEQDRGREQNLPPATHPRPSELSFPKGSHDQFSPGPTPSLLPIETPENLTLLSGTMDTKPQEHPHSIAADKPSNQSSYTEKISSATSAIADKAVSAKNIVASKLGYGEKDQTTTNESREGQDPTKQTSAIDYGKKMAATVTEKLTPVYEKVAGAGSTVMSKLHGPGTGTASEVETEVQEQDKGVSMKGYIAEKLRPGEEDRALSEIISDALHKRREEYSKKETRARGKVTESEEVARRLGTGDERDERAGSGSVKSPTKGVVDKLKGAVGSWFGKGEESQGIQQAQYSSYGNAGSSSSGN